MLVRATASFIPAVGPSIDVGDIFDLPPGVDWLAAGLVVPAEKGAKATRDAVTGKPKY